MERLTAHDLMLATGGHLRNLESTETPFDQISIDSRQVEGSQVFWALKGETHDGHDFVRDAWARNAPLCVVAAHRPDSHCGPCLIVDDTLTALGKFAHWYRGRMDPLVIGVTGSVGKTTTREFIHSALSPQFRGVRSQSNFNNLIGLPLSLLSLESAHEFAVFEMGASGVGDIRSLCELAEPEVGVVTAIGPAHLRTFGSMDAIIVTKGELLEQLPSTGFAVLPGDDPVLRQMADRAPCPVIFVGEGDDNTIRATRVESNCRILRFQCEGQRFEIPVTGRHLVPTPFVRLPLVSNWGCLLSPWQKG